MTKRKDEDTEDKGFQIPIEGRSEDKASEEEPKASEEAAQAGEAEAVEAEVLEDEPEADEPDIVAEAEAVVEEAAAADELEKARQEASDWQDRYMRLHAEWDTYRRRTAEQRDYLAVLALPGDPRVVRFARNGGETDLHTEFGGLEQQVLHDEAGLLVARLEEDAHRQGLVDVLLADVEDGGIVLGQDGGEGRGQAGLVLAGNVELDDLYHDFCCFLFSLSILRRIRLS